MRQRSSRLLTVLAVLAVAVVGCGDDGAGGGADASGAPGGTLTASDQAGDGQRVMVDDVLLDGAEQGWVVVHASDDGAPGEVLGTAAVEGGRSSGVEVMLHVPLRESQEIIPMLHVDTGTVGAYEFGTVEGADLPVRSGHGPVVMPLEYEVDDGGP